MTAGHGGGHVGPQDQSGQGSPPQDWSTPPPQDWSVPPAQQPYGYAPAPPASFGPGAPPAMERPTTVQAGIGAFVATLILGLIGSLVTFTQMDDVVAGRLAKSAGDAQLTDEMIRTGLVFGAVISLVVLVLQVLCLVFAWKGYNWARIVLWILGAIGIAGGLAGLGSTNPFGGFVAALGVFQLLLTVAGVVLLALKPSNDWYRYRSWQRATGQR